MKKMGIKAIYRRPNTSKPAPWHIRKLAVTRPNQVWAMDLTYIPMARDLSICAPSWTGSAGRSCHGGCRSRWKQPSASRRWRRHAVMAGRKSSIPTGIAVHLHRLHRRAEEVTDCHLDGWQGCVARQCLRRAALAFDQIRGSLPPCLQDCVRGTRWHRPISELLQHQTPTLALLQS